AAGCHHRADRAQLGHDLVMHGTGFDVASLRQLDDVADGFFDTKSLAMNGHEIFLTPLCRVLDICDLTSRSRPELSSMHGGHGCSPAVNHEARAVIENKRYPTKPM